MSESMHNQEPATEFQDRLKLASMNGNNQKPTASTATPEPELSSDGSTSALWVDDPINLYLMQMGKNKMLNREEEIKAADEIAYWRRRYRMALFASEFVLRGAVRMIQDIKEANCNSTARPCCPSRTRAKNDDSYRSSSRTSKR